MSIQLSSTGPKKYSLFLLFIPLLLALTIYSCGDIPVDSQTQTSVVDSSSTSMNVAPGQFDAEGTIQGRVIDKGTGNALQDVNVALLFQPDGSDNPERSNVTTNGDGEFYFTKVPVNTDGKNLNSENTPYTLEIDASAHDNYRERYLMEVVLPFESTGGDGAANNLVADVSVPLSEQAVQVKGKLQSQMDNRALSGVKVELYQTYNPIINGDSDTETAMLLDSAETGSEGAFEFSGVEEDARIWFRFVDDSDPTQTVKATHYVNEDTPASDGGNPEMDLGIVTVPLNNESGAFYISEITPAFGSDMHPDSLEFVFRFNRAVAQNEYTRTDLGFGSGTIKDDIQFNNLGVKGKAPGDVEFSVEWSTDYQQLTVKPDMLIDANEYELEVGPALINDHFVDEYGNQLSFGSELPYSDPTTATVREFSTNANNAKPHTPVLEVDSTNITTDFYGGYIQVSMDVDESEVPVKEYEIWAKTADNSYELLVTLARDEIAFDRLKDYGISPAGQVVGPLTKLRGSGVYKTPDGPAVHKFKFRAVSKNLRVGDFSNEVMLEDVTKPDLVDVQCFANGIVIYFSEPYNRDQATDPSNYTFIDGNGDNMNIVLEEAKMYDYYFDTATPGDSEYSIFLVPENLSSYTCNNSELVVVSTNVTDLAGNPMDDTDEDGDGFDNTIEY